MKSLGIVGYGSFGRFAAEKLAPYFTVAVFDPHTDVPAGVMATLAQVSAADFVMLAVPLSAYPGVLAQLKPLLGSETVLLDICSVKVRPIELIKQYAPGQKYIAMHPLFGPESAADSFAGHSVIFCESTADTAKPREFCESLGLTAVEMSAEDHDKEMAVVQALTFFVARALDRNGIHQMKLKTPSFQKLLDLAELDKKHTDDLIKTILLGNKHALQARDKFMKDIELLNQELSEIKE